VLLLLAGVVAAAVVMVPRRPARARR
jgi:hypothetical protein